MANFFKEYHKQRKAITTAEEARQTIERIKRQDAEEAERKRRIKLLKEAVKNWYYEFNNSDEEKEKKINVKFYLNTITSIPMFGDTTKKYYTSYGYIPMLLTCFSWGDRSIKRITEFDIINL